MNVLILIAIIIFFLIVSFGISNSNEATGESIAVALISMFMVLSLLLWLIIGYSNIDPINSTSIPLDATNMHLLGELSPLESEYVIQNYKNFEVEVTEYEKNSCGIRFSFSPNKKIVKKSDIPSPELNL